MKIRVVIERPFGRVELEGGNLDEIIEELESFPEWLDIIDKLVLTAAPQEFPPGEREILSGIISRSEEGPLITLPRERLSDKEAIGLLLYAQDPKAIEPKRIGRLLELSGRPSSGFGARLSEMRREGLVVREDGAYRLSPVGKRWVEDLINRLKGGE